MSRLPNLSELPSFGSPGCAWMGVALMLALVGVLAVYAALSAMIYAWGEGDGSRMLLTGFVGAAGAFTFFGLAWFFLRESLDSGEPEELHLTGAAVLRREQRPRTLRESRILDEIMREVADAPSHEEVVNSLAAKCEGAEAPANPKLLPVAFAIKPTPTWRPVRGAAMVLPFAFTIYTHVGIALVSWASMKDLLSKAAAYLRHVRQHFIDPRGVFRHETRDPILYLRAFSEDYGGGEDFPYSAAEESLTHSYTSYGPVVAVGDPREEMPPLGAVRLYFDDSTWRLGVLYLMSVSQLVIIQAGFAPGLLWELGVARRRLEPRRLIVSFAAWEEVDEWKRQAYYLRFKRYAEGLLECALPPEIKAATFITFEPGWRPVLK